MTHALLASLLLWLASGCGGARVDTRSDQPAGEQSAEDRSIPPARTSDDETDGPTSPRRSPPPPVETRETPPR
ncbi:MAG: hypothetical protein IT379_09315 [Deltaproteobacteria bacterium]|nr:hypothetical protein [Deltaproteobacteria bacterium]